MAFFNIADAVFSKSIAAQDSDPQGITWNDDGSKLYEVGFGSDLIYEYDVALPTVTPSPATAITSNTADANGEITDIGGENVDERGFEYTDTTTNYNESFEAHLGNWENSAGNVSNWIRNSGGTFSGSTGPSSGSVGSYYIHVETSSAFSNTDGDTDSIDAVCTDGTMTFDYHQYGTDQGTLYLEGWDGSTWTTIWSSTGDQGNQWNSESQTLSGYSKVRFRNVAAGGFRGDVALDNITVPVGDFSSPSVEKETGTFSTGTYSLGLTGLASSTTYYIRAYAKNSATFSYSRSELLFTTAAPSSSFNPAFAHRRLLL